MVESVAGVSVAAAIVAVGLGGRVFVGQGVRVAETGVGLRVTAALADAPAAGEAASRGVRLGVAITVLLSWGKTAG
jgi:hypothetical protein